MTSLTDVYEGDVGRVASRRRQLVGTGLFLLGAVGLVGAVGLSTTGLGAVLGLEGYGAREVAGIVAGLALPTVVLGVFVVLPAGRQTRATAGIGLSVALFGVLLFQQLYPYNWLESAPLFALVTGIVYFAGVVTTFWCLFVALATFKTRNAPGGSARMEVTEQGTIRLVEEARSFAGLGGIGFFGEDPDGSVETQTNRPGSSGAVSDGGSSDGSTVGEPPESSGQSRSRGRSQRPQTQQAQSPSGTSDAESGFGAGGHPPSDDGSMVMGPTEHSLDPAVANAGPEAGDHSTDGGVAATGTSDTITETAARRGEPDTYCGNCRHFQYVMDDGDIEPYCTYHGTVMDDMDPCPAWLRND